MASPSVIPVLLSYEQSVHPPISPANCPSARPSLSGRLYTILPHPSGCPTSSDCNSTIYTSLPNHLSPPDCLYNLQPSPSDHPPPSHHLYNTPISPSACPSPAGCLTATTTRLPVHLSSPMIQHTQDSSQSLAVMIGEQSRKAKKFHRAFTNYDLLLRALDASSIYLRDSRHVAPPKSGEDAHVTCCKCDFGGTTLNKPSLGFIYVLPRLWDPGGVRSPPNVPRDRSSTLAASRYPYTPRMGHLVNLPNLRRWQDLRTSHVKLDIFIHRNITGLNIAMKKIARSINVIIPALTQPTPTNHERCSPYDRQSSRTSFTATATSYIRVTQILKLHVETASPYEGHTSRTFFVRLLDPTSTLLHHTSGLPKILHQLCLTLLTTLCLWGVPYKRPRQGNTPRPTPTYYPGGRMYVHCWFTTPRWGVTRFYRWFRLCSCGTKPQHSKNHHSVMTSSWEPQCHHDIIMRTPRIMGKPRFSCSRGP